MGTLPQFTGDAALYKTSGHYHSIANETYSRAAGRVNAQMRAGGAGGLGSGGLRLGFWCEAACTGVAAACFAAAIAIENPGVAIACAKAEADCLHDCNSFSSVF